tara:strand:- start:11006 stop:13450 length:2445 start_codon:yes stop_codon:yes gene_type:complete
MALPPLVAQGLNLDDTMGLPDVEIPVDVPMSFEEGAEVMQMPDGGVMVQEMMEMQAPPVDAPFDANLAEFLDQSILGELSNELRGFYQDDLDSRSEWEETYTKGLDLLGLKTDERTTPFEGASGITHPMISESVTQFQAQAYKELLPSGGPVRTQVIGAQTPEREAQANRVKHFMNYQIIEVMEEYDPDMDQMLFYLPLSGSTFKKVYFDPTKQRAVAKFIPAQDLVVPYSASDLQTATRVTHVLRMDENEIRKMQVAGMYRDVELSGGSDQEEDSVRQKVNELEGISKNYSDDVHTVLEFHIDLDIEGFEDVDPMGEPTGVKLPYIVTIDEDSSEILSIRRNFTPDDGLKRKIQYFVHYKFMPGLGFYGFGLIHMIGGLGRAATSLLRQLIDAGTLSNLPAGFKARGVRVRNDDEPLQPGEFRDIDAPGGSIRDAIVPLPYKEPSATLNALMGGLVNDGRRFVALADQQMSNMNQETPVGTTVAMLERGMKVMSAIHKRLHYAQKNEFRLLARIFRDNLPPMYPYEVAGAPQDVKGTDFDARIDVLPVSDPNIFSMSQRIALAQQQLQLAQSNPEMHNLHQAYRRMYQALEVQNIDELLNPPPPPPQPMDPAMENGVLLSGQTPQAFPPQDHDAHIQSHMALLSLPVFQANPAALGGILSHVLQHISLKARAMVEMEFADMQQQLQMAAQMNPTPELQMQAQQMAQQMETRVAQVQAQMIQEIMPAMSASGQDDPSADPLVQIRMQELAIRQMEAQNKAQLDEAKLDLEKLKAQQRAVTDSARLELQEQIADDRNDVNIERINVQREASMRRQ